MKIYTTPDPYNVLAFDEPVNIRPEPITLAGEVIRPGDRITAILGENSSAGFGSFSMAEGFIVYAGKCTITDERGQIEYALFSYTFPRDIFGTVNGHHVAYVAWVVINADDETSLFYETPQNSGRLILPCKIQRHN